VTPSSAAKIQFRAGFVLDVKGQWYWLTAGHVIEDIEKHGLQHSTQIAEEFKLIDQFGTTVIEDHFHYIPFAFENAWRFFEHDDESGMDYGIVALGELEKRALQKNNITPITPKVWQNPSPLRMPFLFVFGFPSDQIEPRYAENTEGFSVIAKPTACGVSMTLEKVQDPKPCRIYAKLGENWPEGELDGFSGGPAFAVTKSGYQIIALQSGWDRPNRVAFVCPLQIVGPRILKAIRNRSKT